MRHKTVKPMRARTLPLILLAAFSLSGCVRTRFIDRVQTVEVRVPVPVQPVYPAPPIRPAFPPMPTADAAPGAVVQALVERGVILAGYVRELESYIAAVRAGNPSN